MQLEDIKNRFTYHPPKEGQHISYESIRRNCFDLAVLINERCPDGREKNLSITALEECCMWANAAIARNE